MFACMNVCALCNTPGAHGGRNRALESLELEPQVVMSHCAENLNAGPLQEQQVLLAWAVATSVTVDICHCIFKCTKMKRLKPLAPWLWTLAPCWQSWDDSQSCDISDAPVSSTVVQPFVPSRERCSHPRGAGPGHLQSSCRAQMHLQSREWPLARSVVDAAFPAPKTLGASNKIFMEEYNKPFLFLQTSGFSDLRYFWARGNQCQVYLYV